MVKIENLLISLQWSNNDESVINLMTRQRGIYDFNSQEIPIVDEYLTRYDVERKKYWPWRRLEKPQKPSSAYSEAIRIRTGSKEQRYYKAYMD